MNHRKRYHPGNVMPAITFIFFTPIVNSESVFLRQFYLTYFLGPEFARLVHTIRIIYYYYYVFITYTIEVQIQIVGGLVVMWEKTGNPGEKPTTEVAPIRESCCRENVDHV